MALNGVMVEKPDPLARAFKILGYQLKTGQKATRYALLYHVLMTKKTERPKKFAQRAV